MADETPAPLSDAEVKGAIDEAIQYIEVFRADRAAGPIEHAEIDANIALLERIPATLAAYREIVAAVANEDVMCARCDMSASHIRHTPDCPVTRARAALGTQTPGTTGAMAGEEGEADGRS